MKSKYTHKFIIFNEKKIKENCTDLAELEDTIPQDLREKACEISEDFEKRRKDFLRMNKSEL